MAIVEFNPDKPGPDDIQRVYEECVAGIECKFNPTQNPTYADDFALLGPETIEERKRKMLDELSLRSSFFLLAYIETLFRTDFVLRVESHTKGRKDELTRMYKSEYNPAQKVYAYSLTEFIFNKWKLYANSLSHSKEMLDILRTLPQYFDLRNWMAHGRYWKYKELTFMRKYNYLQTKILLANINLYFGPFLKKKTFLMDIQ